MVEVDLPVVTVDAYSKAEVDKIISEIPVTQMPQEVKDAVLRICTDIVVFANYVKSVLETPTT